MKRPLVALIAALSLATLAACGHTSNDNEPTSARTWVAQQNDPPPVVDPQFPGQEQPNEPGNPPPQAPSGGGKPGTAQDPNVVADHLKVPWGLAMLPDGSALVGERPTGRIVQVEPQRQPVHTVERISGIDPSGEGGLLGIAVSPSYNEDGLVFAYITTRTDARVVRFSLGGTPRPILTGLPRGTTAVGGALAFGPDGNLYVSVGDTGRPARAATKGSLAGKILRVTIFGKPAAGNLNAASPVYASGFHNVTAFAWDKHGRMYATEDGTKADELDLITKGAKYGWPSADPGDTPPLLAWQQQRIDAAGCAVLGFGVFVGELTGQKLLAVSMNTKGKPQGAANALLKKTYGRLRTVVADDDGALWITTSNRDGHGRPVPSDDRVLRIKPPSSATDSPA